MLLKIAHCVHSILSSLNTVLFNTNASNHFFLLLVVPPRIKSVRHVCFVFSQYDAFVYIDPATKAQWRKRKHTHLVHRDKQHSALTANAHANKTFILKIVRLRSGNATIFVQSFCLCKLIVIAQTGK